MERLTVKRPDGTICIKREVNGRDSLSNYMRSTDIEAVRRLAAYEDTGMAPEELSEKEEAAYDLGYQSCLNYKGMKWTEAEELQRYRDTGLTPEQVKDMAENAETMLLTWFESRYGFPVGELMRMCEAKQEGRLVVLPCKVGGKIFDILFDRVAEETVATVVVFMSQSVNRMTINAQNKRGAITEIDLDRFGKTVFLSREEAEAALRG